MKKLQIRRANTGGISVSEKSDEFLKQFTDIPKVQDVDLKRIKPNTEQPRKDLIKNIDKLKESIESEGLLQPIILAKDKTDTDKYIIIAGHRRFTAHQQLKRATIQAIIHNNTYTDDELSEKALLENLQREDLSVYEKAITLHRLSQQEPRITKLEKITGYHRRTIGRYRDAYQDILDKKITKEDLLIHGIKKYDM